MKKHNSAVDLLKERAEAKGYLTPQDYKDAYEIEQEHKKELIKFYHEYAETVKNLFNILYEKL